MGDPTTTKDWIQEIEELLEALECIDQKKVRYVAIKLTGEAKRWWIVENNLKEADGVRASSWPSFK